MLNKSMLLAVIIIWSAASLADTVTVNPDHPESYVVQKGDTLWDITGRFLNEPWMWPGVWEANPQIENPHLIYPGDVVSLRYQDGRPILYVHRGQGGKDSRYVRLSPEVRSSVKDDAIPAIPIDAIKQFLSRPLVVTDEEMEEWPYVVSSYDQHLVAGSGNKIYVRGIPDEVNGERYAIYRKGKPFINPQKDEGLVLGYEALHVGDALLEKTGDPASAIISRANREVLVGDRLAEESEADVNTNFIPKPPVRDVNGNILSVIDGVSEIGQYQVVVVDLGTNEGMESGTVLGVYQSGEVVTDYIAAKAKEEDEDEPIRFEREDTSPVDSAFSAIANDIRNSYRALVVDSGALDYMGRPGAIPEEVQLPQEFSAVLMVFRTFENLSYALVMEAQGPIHIYDVVRNL